MANDSKRDMHAGFKALEQKIAEIDRNQRRTDQRLDGDFKVAVEHFADLVKKAAEGYSATLDALVRQIHEIQSEMRETRRDIREMRRDWQVKWNDHDDVLRAHERRIRALE